jgi:isoleucyl-tRNA synthetase
VVDPWEVVNKYGADAFRWYFYSSGSLTAGARFSEKGVLETLQRFIIPLWNVYSFFTIYANLDGFDPRTQRTSGSTGTGLIAWDELTELDKWIRLKFNRLVAESSAHLERLELPEAAKKIEGFVDELSNWYVRRSRRRFWSSEHDNAKQGAYQMLYFVLCELSKLLAPFTPFLAEELHQKLVVKFRPVATGDSAGGPSAGAEAGATETEDSVHLCRYPLHDAALEDELLEYAMDQALRVTTLGHSARKESRLRVRQPLSRVVLVSREPGLRQAVESHRDILLEELNVKQLEFAQDEKDFVSFSYKPNFREIGPRFGDNAKDIAAWVNRSAEEISRQLEAHADTPVNVTVFDRFVNEAGEEETIPRTESRGWVEFELGDEKIVLDTRYFDVQLHPHEGMVAQREGGLLVVLDTHLTEELKLEGLAREVVNRLQQKRKELDLPYDARVSVSYSAPDELEAAIAAHREYISGEVLASDLRRVETGQVPPDSDSSEIDGHELRYSVTAL